jgi:hypothetical protein
MGGRQPVQQAATAVNSNASEELESIRARARQNWLKERQQARGQSSGIDTPREHDLDKDHAQDLSRALDEEPPSE